MLRGPQSVTANLRGCPTLTRSQCVASLPNPNYIFALKGFHGGMWRCAWALESVGIAMAVLGRVWRYHPEGL